MTVKGTWTLNQNLDWARVLVYLPDTGAQTRQATYTVGGSDSTSPNRVVSQRAGGWVSIGAFHFTGTPAVSLSNSTLDGTGDEDVAWDAVAFQPLTGKPANSIVRARSGADPVMVTPHLDLGTTGKLGGSPWRSAAE